MMTMTQFYSEDHGYILIEIDDSDYILVDIEEDFYDDDDDC